MKRKELLKLIVGISLVAVLAISIPLMSSCAPTPAAPTPVEPTPAEPTPAEPAAVEPTFHWRVQTTYGPPFTESFFVPYFDKIEKMSGGQLTFSVYSYDELIPAQQAINSLQTRALELVSGAGTLCAVPVDIRDFDASTPFAWQSQMELWVLWKYKGLEELYVEAYEELGGIKWVTAHPDSNINAVSTYPIEKYEDFNGLKARVSSLSAVAIADAGAVAVDVPYGEIYLAGQTGLLDASICVHAMEAVAMGWDEVFPYFLTNPFTGSALAWFIASEEAWNELPPGLQEIVSEELESLAMNCMVLQYAEEPIAWQNFTLTTLSDEEWAKIVEPQRARWDEFAKVSPRVAKVRDIIVQFNKDMDAVGWWR